MKKKLNSYKTNKSIGSIKLITIKIKNNKKQVVKKTNNKH